MTAPVSTASAPWIGESDCDLVRFRAQVERDTDLAAHPLADGVRSNVLVYSASTLADDLTAEDLDIALRTRNERRNP